MVIGVFNFFSDTNLEKLQDRFEFNAAFFIAQSHLF
jgi:hypothetical protein